MRDIEFVSYDGKYPNLCSGTLVLKIDGEDHSFRNALQSGGMVTHDGKYNHWSVYHDEWDFHPENDFSEENQDIIFTEAEKKWIKMLINENVEWGCCGGCVEKHWQPEDPDGLYY